MSEPRRYRWLALRDERQHVFVDGRDRSLCQMVFRTPDCVRSREQLQCFWCKRKLRHMAEKLGLVETR